ncbi:MAG: DUF4390 domain-containing protein [Thermodesulfobacteriota bacterium]
MPSRPAGFTLPGRSPVPWRSLALVLAALFAGLLPAQPAPAAEPPAITEVIVTNSQTELLVYLSVADGFPPEVVECLHSGMPLTFTFFLELSEVRPAWPDRTLVEHSLERILTYDSLRDEYRITEEEGDRAVVTIKAWRDAKARMAALAGFRMAPLSVLVPEGRYRLAAKVKLTRKGPAVKLLDLVPFLSFWDQESDWHAVEFRY